ncbi:hypothetical protein B4147_5032 [Bacillus wiedmannii]|uniref:Uncharacterized protein n=1 Tax=Bacillus wiedmannii TaxID=1890302 RepID=A0A0G8C2Q8_9BACI|nr:hypothetical protein B4147_5032 [Bacillus wiedmannii]
MFTHLVFFCNLFHVKLFLPNGCFMEKYVKMNTYYEEEQPN